MKLSEFDIIGRYFSQQAQRNDVLLGVGDDCALLQVPSGMTLAVTMDTLIAGRHFPEETAPEAIGHKALAVSLSDLAAMGAEPAWATLSLSLPAADPAWLDAFAAGLFRLAASHRVALVGGDTVRGPLVITLQLHGFVPEGQALRRDGARPGDHVYVTGTLGDAGGGLAALAAGRGNGRDRLQQRLDYPEPRVSAGQALRAIASAAIDISDGLLADLGHILERSGYGVSLDPERLPLSDALLAAFPRQQALELAMTAGDDYELCFTVPPSRVPMLASLPVPCTRIGIIEPEPGLRITGRDAGRSAGYDHFAGDD